MFVDFLKSGRFQLLTLTSNFSTFLGNGDVGVLLDRPRPKPKPEPEKGRSLFFVKEGDPITYVYKENSYINFNRDKQTNLKILKNAVGKVSKMMSLYKEGDYTLRERWMNRHNKDTAEDALDDFEWGIISTGNASLNYDIVRSIDRVDLVSLVDITFKFDDDEHDNFDTSYTVEVARVTLENGATITEANVGIFYGKPVTFPWMTDTEKENLALFIEEYNAKTAEIFTGQTNKAEKATLYHKLKHDMIPLWLKCISEVKMFGAWTLDVPNLNLLYSHTAQTMSAFTWWGDASITEWSEQEEEDILYDSKMLVPYNQTSSFRSIHEKFGGLRRDRFHKHKKPPPKMETSTDIPNPYAILRDSSGGQIDELRTLSSYLGSGVHMCSADKVITKNHVVTAVGNLLKLEAYIKLLPKIVPVTADAMIHKIERFVAVEFPVYYHRPILLKNKQTYFYSRIDAISETPNQDLNVWEYKTRWGYGKQFQKKADLHDIRQAAVYCFLLQKMVIAHVKHFSIRYVHADTTTKTILSTYTHRFQYSPELHKSIETLFEKFSV